MYRGGAAWWPDIGMGSGIFISYRKSDDPAFAGRLYDRLETKFSSKRLFMDVASIRPGSNFAVELREKVANCDLLLAIIGKNWATATDESGTLRLHKADDWVRIEIEEALRLGKLVIPVLANHATQPTKDQLPIMLRPLTELQFVRLTHETFNADALRLADAIEEALRDIEQQRKREEAARKAQLGDNQAWEPLSKGELDKRFENRVVPEYGLRIVPRYEHDGFPSTIGQPNAMYAFIGDYHEYKGRFLKDIERDMHGLHGETVVDFYAIMFRIDSDRFAEFGLLPASREAIYNAITQFAHLQDESSSILAPNDLARRRFELLSERLMAFPVTSTREDFDKWMDHINKYLDQNADSLSDGVRDYWQKAKSAISIVQDGFGISASFIGTGRGLSEFAARHFLVRNLQLNRLDFEVHQLGRTQDLKILR
jgi:hypothetical protein